MKLFQKKYAYFLFLVLLYIVCFIIVQPFGNFPLNDDWAYSKSVKLLYETGHFTIGEWGAMSLFTHIAWGFLFTKVFGYSFLALRISTLVSGLIGLWFLYRLVLKMKGTPLVALLVCLVLFFNPIFFNLTFTYMTDVNFNTLLIMCLYFAWDFFETKNRVSFALVFVFSVLLVLLRQYGIIVPACFTLACVFLDHKKWTYALISTALTLGVYFIFKTYENHLRTILPPWAAYKFSGNVNLLSEEFMNRLGSSIISRVRTMSVSVLLYSSPLALMFLPRIPAVRAYSTVIPAALISGIFTFVLCSGLKFPQGNVFYNAGLGVDTFFETLNPAGSSKHLYNKGFEEIMEFLKYAATFVSLLTMVLVIWSVSKKSKKLLTVSPARVLVLGLVFTYAMMIFITESYFDRYNIPLFTLGLVMFAALCRNIKPSVQMASPLLLVFVYASVFGTQDYFKVNSARWEAYHFLKGKNVPIEKINAGFEVNCWNEGRITWWTNFLQVDTYDYIIQYNPEPGFEAIKEFEFTRRLPPKQDKIYIFARNGITLPASK